MIYLYLAIGGTVGTIARYSLGGWVQGQVGGGFPAGTLAVNVIGSLLLGFFVRAMDAWAWSPETRTLLTVGFCGAFTTFSTFSLETMALLESGAWGRAAVYAFGSLGLGLASIAIGFVLAGPIVRVAG